MAYLSARYTRNNDKEKAIIGANIHIKKNLITSVFLRIFFAPNLAIPIPIIAATLSCTNEVGIPFSREAIKSNEADIKAIIAASILPKSIISFPVFLRILLPNIELPMPKHGAIISIEKLDTSHP
jgi:hypothetical protein